ncbi:MAG: uroporphyrinogen decarboxylase family protein [Anaerolineaceae bacterium]
MNHRERVLSAVNHVEPDYVPTALWGSAYGITDPLYFDLIRELKLGKPQPPFRGRKGHTVNYYDDRVLEVLDIDVRHADCGFTDLGGPAEGGGEDAWGVSYSQTGIYISPVGFPLNQASSSDLDFFPWPDVNKFLRREEFQDRARYIREKTDYAVVGRAYDSYGLFERCCSLRKVDQFLIDLVIHQAFALKLIEKVTDVHCRLLGIYLADAGQYLDIIELPGDDYAALHPLISPKMFDYFFAPAWRRIINLIKSTIPQVKILFHSDGNMEPFLDRLIDLGVDIFHCLEPLPTVDMSKIKAVYGSKLCFWGAIDIKQALQEDEATVEAEVKKRISLLGLGGGYVLAPSNHLQPDIPAQNVVALFKLARKYGGYPLNEKTGSSY